MAPLPVVPVWVNLKNSKIAKFKQKFKLLRYDLIFIILQSKVLNRMITNYQKSVKQSETNYNFLNIYCCGQKGLDSHWSKFTFCPQLYVSARMYLIWRYLRDSACINEYVSLFHVSVCIWVYIWLFVFDLLTV